jgi:hypothetical protein
MENPAEPLALYESIQELSEDALHRFPKVGSSLGLCAEGCAPGTLGGYVSIDGPCKGRYALTADSVVFPPSRPNPAGYRNFLKIDSKRDIKPNVQQPAARDLKTLVEWLEYEQINFREQVEDLRARKIRAQQGIDSFNSALRKSLEGFENGLKETTRQLENAQLHNPDLGFVALSSGRRKLDHPSIEGFRMDWALIYLDPRRFDSSHENASNTVKHILFCPFLLEVLHTNLPLM